MIGAALVAAFSIPAQAQVFCADREGIIASLARNFAEVPRAIGLVSTGDVLEVLISPTGTWSILISNTAGRSCALASGEAWESIEPVIPKKGSPS